MPSVKPVTRDPDSKKRKILAAARCLLVKRGFQDIVLDDVAKEAGVAKGTLFLHYKDKDELFTAVFADLVDGLGRELDGLLKVGVEGKELLAAAAQVVLSHFDHSRDFMAQFSTGRFPGCGDRSCGRLMDKMRANLERMRRLIAASSQDGGRSIADLDFAAAAFFGLCRSATMRKILFGGRKPLEGEADRVLGFFLEGSGISL